MGNKTMVYLGRDAVVSLTKTSFPAGVPDIDSDAEISDVFILSGVTATATSSQIIDTYNAADWADAAKPAVAHHIMISVAERKWKAKDALVDGDLLVAHIFPKGSKIKTS